MKYGNLLRLFAGLPLLALAAFLNELGAYDFAWRVYELAKRVGGVR